MKPNQQKLRRAYRRKMNVINILKHPDMVGVRVKERLDYYNITFATIGIFLFLMAIIVSYSSNITNDMVVYEDDYTFTGEIVMDTMIDFEGVVQLSSSQYKKYKNSIPDAFLAFNTVFTISQSDFFDIEVKRAIDISFILSDSLYNLVGDMYDIINNNIFLSQIQLKLPELERAFTVSAFEVSLSDIIQQAVILQERMNGLLKIDVYTAMERFQREYKIEAADYYILELKSVREESLNIMRRIYVERYNAKQDYDTNYNLQIQATTNLQEAIAAANNEEAKHQSKLYTQYALAATKAMSDYKIYDKLYRDMGELVKQLKVRIEFVHQQYINIVL